MHAALFSVLGDPVRLEIVEMLAAQERTAGEIASRFAVSGPAVSRHLRVLREAGVATYRQEAQRRVYALNPSTLNDVEGWAHQLLQQWQTRFEALGRHLDNVASKTGDKT
jgi:DNA-binding transcriptional ArsR family regulator